ncbi:hypothetical protein SALBM311S_12683 [Streptomyces alboniger]
MLLGGATCLLAQILGLFLGEAEDLLDTRAETAYDGSASFTWAWAFCVSRWNSHALFQSGDAGESAVTIGDELRYRFTCARSYPRRTSSKP